MLLWITTESQFLTSTFQLFHIPSAWMNPLRSERNNRHWRLHLSAKLQLTKRKCKTDHFRNSFIIRSCIDNIYTWIFSPLYLVLYTHVISSITCKYAIQPSGCNVLVIKLSTYLSIYLSIYKSENPTMHEFLENGCFVSQMSKWVMSHEPRVNRSDQQFFIKIESAEFQPKMADKSAKREVSEILVHRLRHAYLMPKGF